MALPAMTAADSKVTITYRTHTDHANYDFKQVVDVLQQIGKERFGKELTFTKVVSGKCDLLISLGLMHNRMRQYYLEKYKDFADQFLYIQSGYGETTGPKKDELLKEWPDGSKITIPAEKIAIIWCDWNSQVRFNEPQTMQSAVNAVKAVLKV